MGLQLRTPVGRQIILLKKINMNKFLAIVCLAAGAMAEAEADPYYAAYGYAGLPVAGAYGASVYGAGAYGAYRAYPYGIGHAAGYASASPSASVSINGLAPAAVPAVAGAYASAHAGAYTSAYGAYPYAAAYGAYPYAAYSGYSNVSPSASLSIAGAAPAAVPVAAGLPA